jgi:aminopeptidase N
MIFKLNRRCFALACVVGSLLSAKVGAFESEEVCHQVQAFAPGDSSEARKYAPSREIDIIHLALDVTPDFKQRSVSGKATLRFKPVAKPFQELRLDGIDLTVFSVTSNEKIMGWQATAKNVIVTFDQPIPPDQEASVTVEYRAQPTQGLYFRTPEMGYKPEDMHVWSQGETTEARHWYPCWDSPNAKFTSEITCHVPQGMVVLSNGKMMSEEKESGSGLVAVRWSQDKPHANYLVCLVAGYLKKVEDKYKDVPLAFWTPASQIDQAANSFKDTKEIMAFFEEEIGVPYPWAKYYQVCVDDFTFGGMENTSITTLNESTLHTTDFEELHSSQGLVAHEMAHQWFGDLVTCKDWANTWLNEGFATYYDALYDGHKHGRDALLYDMHQSAKGILNQPNQTNAVVRRNFNVPEDQFSFLAYPKGGWVLHMLRSQLGEDLYRRCIKTYLQRHQFGNVVTEDLNRVIEELSGRSFDQFFDQWIYHASQPDLAVSYSWDERAKLAKVSIAQNQKLSEDVLLFNFPITIRFKGKSGTTDRQITVKDKSADFFFALPEPPEVVRVDPEMTVLATINFSPPSSMLYAQLADKTDMLGRLLAVEQLGAKKDRGAVSKLKDRLNNDSFYGVRLAAARALRGIGTDESRDALRDSMPQKDARVREQVVAASLATYGEPALAAAQKTLQDEKNPEIRALAIQTLGAYPKSETRETLLRFLNTKSYRNQLAGAAITAMRAQDDTVYIEPIRDALRQKEADFTTGGFSRGLEALAYLARNEEKKDSVRELLLQHVNSKKKGVQLAAINGLATLGDAKAIAVLETFATAAKDSPERGAAEKAISSLRDTKKPSAELGAIRGEVLNLQKDNRQLRKDFDELKQKLEARSIAPGNKTDKSEKQSTTSKPARQRSPHDS